MATTNFKNVNEYLAAQPPAVRPLLQTIRKTIQAALPEAEEVISYQIPAYRLNDRVVIYFSGWKSHIAIYPASKTLISKFKTELEPYEYNDKGTLRFPLSKPDTKLIAKLAKFRAQEIATAKARPTARKSADRVTGLRAPRR